MALQNGNFRIQFELSNYKPNTSGKIVNGSEEHFIGRKEILNKTTSTMNQLDRTGQRRSFLVTGYRGSGKTLFVNKVIRDYQAKYESKIKHQERMEGCAYQDCEAIYLNLGNSKNLEINPILFDMARQLKFRLASINLKTSSYTQITSGLFVLSLCMVAVWAGIEWYHNQFKLLLPAEFSYHSALRIASALTLVETGLALLSFSLLSRTKKIAKGRFFPGILYKFYNRIKLKKSLDQLIEDIDYTVTSDMKATNGALSFGQRKARRDITERECEIRLIEVLELCKYSGIRVIYIFDELDKISLGDKDQRELIELKDRKNQIDLVLSGLKNIISYGHAYFFFIAGREIFDTYHSEIGKTGNLYENLFDEIINVPSLLKDFSDGQPAYPDSMIERFVISVLFPCGDKNISIDSIDDPHFTLAHHIHEGFNDDSKDPSEWIRHSLFLRSFINYLTLRSWGNCKRLTQLFHQYVQPSADSSAEEFNLVFSIEDQQRILLGSFLYNSLYRSMADKLIRGDDKLVVSTLLIFDHILKFHNTGFSRRHLERVATVLNIHSSPELTDVIDSIINSTLYPYLRHIRNGVHDLRFSSLLSNELKYSSYINPVESALFNFSLGANEDVKLFYQEQINGLIESPAKNQGGMISLAKYHSILADLYRWERKFDKAVQHYDQSVEIYLNAYKQDETNIELHSLIYSLLNAGNVYEISGAFSSAESYYHHALVLLAIYRNHHAYDHGASPYLSSISQACMAMYYVQAKSIKNSITTRKPMATRLPRGKINLIQSGSMISSIEIVVGEDKEVFKLDDMTLLRTSTLYFINQNLDGAIDILSSLSTKYKQTSPTKPRNAHFLSAISNVRLLELNLYKKMTGIFETLSGAAPDEMQFSSEDEYWSNWKRQTRQTILKFSSQSDASVNTELSLLLKGAPQHAANLCRNNLKIRGIMQILSIFNIKIALTELFPADLHHFLGLKQGDHLPPMIRPEQFRPIRDQLMRKLITELKLVEGESNYQPLLNFIYRDLDLNNQQGNYRSEKSEKFFSDLKNIDLNGLLRWDSLIKQYSNPNNRELIHSLSPLLTNQSPLSQLIWAYGRWASLPDYSDIPIFEDSSSFSVRSRLFELLLEAKNSYETIDSCLLSYKDLSHIFAGKQTASHFDTHCIISVYQSVYTHFRLIKSIQRFVDNDSHIMCPPICYAYYGMWKLLFRLVASLALGDLDCEFSINKAMNKAMMLLCTQHETAMKGSNQPSPSDAFLKYRPLYDFSNIESLAISSLETLGLFKKPIGSAKRNVFSSKYVISDDYEDSLFLMETYFYKLVSLSADTHINFMKYCRSQLESTLEIAAKPESVFQGVV